MTNEETLRERVTGAIRQALSDGEAMQCTRVWEAWLYKTMTDEDFADASDGPLPDEITAAVLPIIAAEVQAAKAEAVDEFAASLADHLDLATPRAWDFCHPCDPPGVRWEPNARDLALMGVADMLRNDTLNPYRAADIEKEY